jgi:hypothetical protein
MSDHADVVEGAARTPGIDVFRTHDPPPVDSRLCTKKEASFPRHEQTELVESRGGRMRREQVRTVRFGIAGVSLLLAITLGALAASGSTSAPPRRSGVVTITYRDKGSTVHVAPGQKIRVVLGSTYWRITRTSGRTTLAPIGAEHVVARQGCVAGEGCGTATSWFRATRAGAGAITATRGSCGEALRCTNGRGTFHVTVRVN